MASAKGPAKSSAGKNILSDKRMKTIRTPGAKPASRPKKEK